jgi:hypothetical protein
MFSDNRQSSCSGSGSATMPASACGNSAPSGSSYTTRPYDRHDTSAIKVERKRSNSAAYPSSTGENRIYKYILSASNTDAFSRVCLYLFYQPRQAHIE